MFQNSKQLFCQAALAGLLATSLPAAAAPVAAVPTLKYTLAMPAPQTHYFEVKMELGGFPTDYTDIKMPVWTPGSYLVREYAKNVEGFEARTASGQALGFEKINKNTWRVRHPKQGAFQVSYRVYAFDLTVRTSFIDGEHGYLNGASVFMYPADNKALASTVLVQPAAGWAQVSTSLRPGPGKFTYKSSSYDELVDSPMEIGNHKVLEFNANGTPHQVAMFGNSNADETKLLADMKKVCEEAHRVVGQNPLDRYLFIVHNLERGGGGLEHQFSTTLEVARNSYGTEAGYKSFLGLVAHEYFHLWNVKRIRPVALGPFNYDQENYTNMLWVSEGITTYYSKVINLRAGYTTREEFLNGLANDISSVENTPGNRVQSAAESSFDAWIKSYRQNENSRNSEINYYAKGDLIGTLLDLNIAEATKGEKHLDDVFRLLYDTYYKKANRGFTDKEFQDAVAQVAGRRYDEFFSNSVYGTKTLDYATALGYAGLAITSAPLASTGTLGANFSNRTGKLLVASVVRGGAAWDGGLSPNDEVLLINGVAPSNESAQSLITSPVGTEMKLQVRRDGLTRDVTLKTLANLDRKYQIQPVAAPTAAQQRVLARWLGSAK
ncbi:peptidase M61 [Hymenobacter lapidarius]|uniref:Peptidase M61 n=1 Tax=Hymenobacter lapidarius TaxID=1908237 RepID=A0A1G1T9Q4_9BACT|nr:PDZ domain-containing protein [Hymenobacter lapidarius]OGX87604.1 peptidase M61 [Hymenobacter lapidarius]